MLRLYNFQSSGNCYKIRLLLHRLEIPFERIDVALFAGEARSDAFRARNPLGETPFIELDDGRVLAESSAILWHLAEGSALSPADQWCRAQILQWLSFEQYRLEPNIGTPRMWLTLLGAGEKHREEIAAKQAKGRAALTLLERHFADREFAASPHCSIADLALYAYIHVADEAGYDLAPYPALRRWLARVAAAPRHIAIDADIGMVIPWPERRAS